MRRRSPSAIASISIAIPLAIAGVAGCGRTVGEGECKELVAKMVDLLAESGSSEHVSEVKSAVESDPRTSSLSRETCVGKVTRSQYECMMAAKSLEAFAGCDEK